MAHSLPRHLFVGWLRKPELSRGLGPCCSKMPTRFCLAGHLSQFHPLPQHRDLKVEFLTCPHSLVGHSSTPSPPHRPPHLQLPLAFVKGDLRAECGRQTGGPGGPNKPSARLKTWPSPGLSSQREWSSFPTKRTLWLSGRPLGTSRSAFPPPRPEIPSGCFIIAPRPSIPG